MTNYENKYGEPLMHFGNPLARRVICDVSISKVQPQAVHWTSRWAKVTCDRCLQIGRDAAGGK